MDPDLRRAIPSLDALPPIPEVLAKIWRLTGEADTTAVKLAETVAQDPGLAADLLKIINSSYYGFSRQISSILQAITLLGFKAVRSLSVTIVVKNRLLPRRREPITFNRSDFWKHCVGTSLTAEALARKAGGVSPDDASTAGLLHDVGVMVLDLVAPEILERLIEALEKERAGAGGNAELDVLGCSHADIGKLLAESWDFPPLLATPIAQHHQPLEAPSEHQRISAIVHVADLLMASPAAPYHQEEGLEEDNPVLASLGLSLSTAEEIRDASTIVLQEARELVAL